jgi:hypothetical protein
VILTSSSIFLTGDDEDSAGKGSITLEVGEETKEDNNLHNSLSYNCSIGLDMVLAPLHNMVPGVVLDTP